MAVGWYYDEAGLQDHEGYASLQVRDGREVAAPTATGLLVWRPDCRLRVVAAQAAGRAPAEDELYEWVPWRELAGWLAACSCGWRGPQWDHAATLPGERGGVEPDDAYLVDGVTIEDEAYDTWVEHMRPLRSASR